MIWAYGIGLLIAAVIVDRFVMRRFFRPRVFDLHGRSTSILVAMSEGADNK